MGSRGDSRRVLIIGAGVGGLTTAIALRRTGIEPVVFERASDLTRIQVEGGLQVWTDGMKALRHLGLMDALLDATAELQQCEFRSASGGRMVSWSDPLKYAGYSVWQTAGKLECQLPPPELFGMWYGRGKRFIYYRVGGGQQHWAAIFNSTPGAPVPEGGRKAALLDWYSSWESPIPQMIEATDESAISQVEVYGRTPLPRWGSRRSRPVHCAHPRHV